LFVFVAADSNTDSLCSCQRLTDFRCSLQS